MATDISTSDATGRLARYVLDQAERFAGRGAPGAPRAFLNILGCMLGGARHETVDAAQAALGPFAGAPTATLIGRGEKSDPLHAALINCLASSVHSFDDTHALAIVHPSGPVAAAALAVAEQSPVSRPTSWRHSRSGSKRSAASAWRCRSRRRAARSPGRRPGSVAALAPLLRQRN